MGAVTSAIESVPPVTAYAIIAALVFGEAAIFLGFVVPGETAVLIGGFLASLHHLNIVVLIIVVFLAAVIGDSVGYEVGRKFGPRLIRTRLFMQHQARLDKGRDMLRTKGGPAVFLGRFTAFFRAVMPGLAGLSQMQYRKFLAWNALGGFVWGTTFCLVGYFAGASYAKVASRIGTGAAIFIGLLVVGVFVVWHVRRRRREGEQEADRDAGQTVP